MSKVFNINIQNNLEAMASESKFVDVREGETKIFRFAPPVVESGLIFYMTFNHYKLKNEDRSIALADLSEHGTDETGREDYIMALSKVLMDHGATDAEKKIGKEIKGNRRYYAQGWEGTLVEEGVFKYGKLKLLALPKTAAEQVMDIIRNQQSMGTPPATDPKRGQAILITRTGKGFQTRYKADRSGVEADLDEIVPDWQNQLYDDVYEALALNIYPPEEQKRIAQLSYPNLDWEWLEMKFNL